MNGRCITGCGRRAAHRHHVIYEQEIRLWHGDVRDPRNLVEICFGCHARHHARQEPVLMCLLPDSAFRFARELMGGPAAYEYLRRRYRGNDMRLDRLLEGSEDDAGAVHKPDAR